MKITYTLTFWEHMRSGVLYTRLILPVLYPVVYIILAFALIAMPLMWTWSTFYLLHKDGISPLDLGVVFTPLITPLFTAGLLFVLWRLCRRQTVTLDSEAISFQYFGHRNRKSWKAVDSVEEDESYIYISAKPPRVPFLSAKLPRRQAFFIMIPQHGFPSSAEADEFLAQAMDYWQPDGADEVPHPEGSWPPAPTAKREAKKPGAA